MYKKQSFSFYSIYFFLHHETNRIAMLEENISQAFLLVKMTGIEKEHKMVQLIKKGGLRERANRSARYQGSENTETTLKPNRYAEKVQTKEVPHLESALASQQPSQISEKD